MPRIRDTSPQTLRVLQALLHDPQEWRYGYDLSKETGLASGTLYPILMRLSERELLDAQWTPPARPGLPARHTYRLTGEGMRLARERLTARTEAVQAKPATGRLRQAMEAFLTPLSGYAR
ncbi:PadR family transcriptional regulator [Micromonospora olivasterospora]|uniref:PadR family transcriptional regulator n=1 Tax=Micromonospora olivasterospora TaxID=1880 RepID=A0A562I576_MICOL|nr:PadR family transcriptional regulator [Micromonospora olivasterospora]TWH65865.1 PadR family transcriptional regulator [Micromonospora olivasterospora]